MLVVKLELEKNKENYQAVMEALAAFDIASAAWETVAAPVEAKSGRSGDDLSSAVSDAINSVQRRSLGS